MPVSFDPDWQALIVGSGVLTVPGTTEPGVQIVAFTVGDGNEADLSGWTQYVAIESTLGDGGIVHHYLALRPASASSEDISLSGFENDAAGVVGTFPAGTYLLTPQGAGSIPNPEEIANVGFPIEETIATPGVSALATFAANDSDTPLNMTVTPQSGDFDASSIASDTDGQGAVMKVRVIAIEPADALTDVQWSNGNSSDRRWAAWVGTDRGPRWFLGKMGWAGSAAATYSIDFVECGHANNDGAKASRVALLEPAGAVNYYEATGSANNFVAPLCDASFSPVTLTGHNSETGPGWCCTYDGAMFSFDEFDDWVLRVNLSTGALTEFGAPSSLGVLDLTARAGSYYVMHLQASTVEIYVGGTSDAAGAMPSLLLTIPDTDASWLDVAADGTIWVGGSTVRHYSAGGTLLHDVTLPGVTSVGMLAAYATGAFVLGTGDTWWHIDGDGVATDITANVTVAGAPYADWLTAMGGGPSFQKMTSAGARLIFGDHNDGALDETGVPTMVGTVSVS